MIINEITALVVGGPCFEMLNIKAPVVRIVQIENKTINVLGNLVSILISAVFFSESFIIPPIAQHTPIGDDDMI